MDRRYRWVAFLAAIAVAIAVGLVAYNMGVSEGLAISSAQGGAPAGGAGPYAWHRPWHFGFFGPFLFVFFWFLLFRVFFWGGFHRRWRYWGPYDPPSQLDEWHRRAHERMENRTPQGPANN